MEQINNRTSERTTSYCYLNILTVFALTSIELVSHEIEKSTNLCITKLFISKMKAMSAC